MPRDTRGRVVAPDKDEKVRGQKATESEEYPSKRMSAHASHLADCPDCLKMVEKHMGLEHKADDMKSEDQGGKAGNPGKGHDTEKRTPSYGRKRH